jgi:hypothetical protein
MPKDQPAPFRRTDRAAGRALTRRAVVIGMLLVTFVAAFAPYNDYVLHNSPFIGNHFPIGIVTLMAVLVLLINPAITLLKGRPLAPVELITIMTMLLIGASVPTSGLMRYLEPALVAPWWHVRQFPWFNEVLPLLPSWLVPATDPNSPLVSDYWHGIDPLRGGHIPILPFLLPAVIWSVLVAAIMGGALFLAAIFRRQWVHHERLSYPLATLPLELLAAPEPGRLYNPLWRNSLLWTGAAIPFLVYFLAGLHSQSPAVPQVDLHFDVHAAFTDRPWDALPPFITEARVYFAVIGICFFVPSEVALSLWLFVLINGLANVFFARTSFDPGQQENSRAMGTYVAYFAGLLWLARGHLKFVLLSAWKNSPRADDEAFSYRTILLGWLICTAVAWLWLIMVGMNPFLALLLLGVGAMLLTLMSRIVAETGLFYVSPIFWPRDFFSALIGKAAGMKNYLWTEMLSGIFYGDLRENIMPYATNALRMGQEIPATSASNSAPGARPRNDRAAWFRWLIVALITSAIVSAAMNHFLSYHYGRVMLADYGASENVPHNAMSNTFRLENSPPDAPLSTAWQHFTFGALFTLALMLGRVLWAAWPFHPIGLVLMSSGPMKVLWFSILIGWAAKRLLLRYGGAGAFRRARPFFIGLIVGEMLSAGAWMFIGLLTNGAVKYTFLPG